MPNAGVTVDSTGEIEDRQILAVDLAAEGVSSGAQTGSASGVTGSETVHETNLTTGHVSSTTGQTVSGTTETQTGTASGSSETQIGSTGITGSETVESLIPAPSGFGAEIDTTGQTSGGVADVGIAAEVDGISEGDDVASDPADGIGTPSLGL